MSEGDFQVRTVQAAQLSSRRSLKLSFSAFRRTTQASALMVAGAGLIVLVAVSPLALKQIAPLGGKEWARLSNIGQTYGAASALLTGLALIGVVGSIVLQVRAAQISREQSSREHHVHLVEMALEDPVYQRCWGGGLRAHATRDSYRQQVYLNLIVSNWEKDYVLGGFPEHALRGSAGYLFRGEAARTFWADARDVRLELSDNRRTRRFCRILEEEYQRATTSGPPDVLADAAPSPAPPSQQPTSRYDGLRTGSTLLLGAIGGVALGKVLWRLRLR